MVGNTSSGIIEAPSLGIPVVNVGDRQKGRPRGANVIDVPYEADAIKRGIARALTPQFRARCRRARSPYETRRPTSEIVAERLAHVPLDERLLLKAFQDA
jgi:UDP-N-acetylglucosamine 2-epimerase